MQAMVQAHQAGSAGADDSEGPRMSMAMRRQLGIAPAKSPSKATSPHGAYPRALLDPQGLGGIAWRLARKLAPPYDSWCGIQGLTPLI